MATKTVRRIQEQVVLNVLSGMEDRALDKWAIWGRIRFGRSADREKFVGIGDVENTLRRLENRGRVGIRIKERGWFRRKFYFNDTLPF